VTHLSTHSLALAEGGLSITVAAVSDRGRVRSVNEDSYLAHPPVFLVADGMGGHRYGDQASSATARTFAGLIPIDQATTVSAVLTAVGESHRRVIDLAEGEQAGTTLSGLAVVREPGDERTHWMAFNIGDSRVYDWSKVSGLVQISVYHSAVQELVDEGVITRLQAESHPERNVITRAVGTGVEPDPDVWLFPIGETQTFLICSDGLTKELDDSTISRLLAEAAGEPGAAALSLVGAALEAGASDNVTVVVVASTLATPVSSIRNTSALSSHLESTLPREDRA
jgi:serine/threonine protein phosphatase PrpC